MNKQIEQLSKLAAKPSRYILGLMSGTSLDGLDLALCHISGSGTDTNVTVEQFKTVPNTDDFKSKLKKVFSNKTADLETVCLLNAYIGVEHAKLINQTLAEWHINHQSIDLIASHGQTIFHAPKHLHPSDDYPNATLQIGDGDHIAVNTGIITISDFRQKHVAAGGEGAPLAVYGDYILFSKKGENRIMLNIGGIANFTFLPADMDGSKVFSTDTGTGNTLMDAYVQQHFKGMTCDKDGAIAATGHVNEALLLALLNHSFFQGSFPKTIGPELFNLAYLQHALMQAESSQLNHADIVATLNMFTAKTIVNALLATIPTKTHFTIYTSGGGMHNPVLIANIKSLLPNTEIKNTNDLGIQPDAKEAVLFALLANECVSGGPIHLGNANKKAPAVTMGKISFPG